MKKKLLAPALIFGFLLALGFYHPNRVDAQSTTETEGVAVGHFKVELTECYSQTDPKKLTGYSNDCVEGKGSCIDNGCPDGSFEKKKAKKEDK